MRKTDLVRKIGMILLGVSLVIGYLSNSKAAFLVAAICSIATFSIVANLQSDMEKRPTALGTIQSSEVIERKDWEGTYCRLVRYEYRVAGQVYVAKEASAAQYKKDAQRLANQTQVGDAITVYYDPSNPSVSTIKPGIQTGTYLLLMPGLLILCLLVGTTVIY